MNDNTETKRSLVGMSFDDYMMTIVGATLSRGNSAPMSAVKSLTQLIGALSGAGLTDNERARVANTLRDVADQIEAPLLDKKH